MTLAIWYSVPEIPMHSPFEFSNVSFLICLAENYVSAIN